MPEKYTLCFKTLFKRCIITTAAIIGSVVLTPSIAWAQIILSDYELVATYLLPPGDFSQNPAVINAHEVSAVTYNWDNNSLFVVGDEGGHITEVSLTGEQVSQMAIFGFNDPEGLTYIGDGQLVIVEERNQDVYRINYTAGSFLFKNTDNAIDLGNFVDNIGLEGISYDPRDGQYITVKEKSPQAVTSHTLDFSTFTAISTSLFSPNLGVADIADVQILATVPFLTGSPDEDNLLLLSQESSRLLKVDRNGIVLDEFDFNLISNSAEGVTIDPEGNIYVVAENGSEPTLYVLQTARKGFDDEEIPFLPWWALLSLASIIGVAGRRLRKANHT